MACPLATPSMSEQALLNSDGKPAVLVHGGALKAINANYCRHCHHRKLCPPTSSSSASLPSFHKHQILPLGDHMH